MLLYLWRNRSCPPLFSHAFFRTWAKRALTLPTLLRMSANRWRLVRQGAEIGPDACIGEISVQGRPRFLKVGGNTFIGQAKLMLLAPIQIGSHVCINDGVTLLTASHDVRDPQWTQFSKPICIGDFAWIAINALILPGVAIGRGAVVGAGAVVSKDVPDFAVAAGNPVVIRENLRARDLSYSPVRFLAFQEAWLGPGTASSPGAL